MSTPAEMMAMSASDKLCEAMRRSLPLLPGEAVTVVTAMVRPESIALIGGTLVAWAGSHAFGVGEVVDVLLLGVGFIALGFSVFEGASEFADFVSVALDARSDAALERAGQHFARAVTVLGISAVQSLLFHGRTQAAVARGRPKVHPRMSLSDPPPSTGALNASRPAALPGGRLGQTDAYGVIEVARNQSISEQRITLLHEMVHRYLSPRTGPLRKLRAEARMSLYARSALMRYLEEVLAEGYGQLRVHGVAQALGAYKFPIAGGYVSISALGGEGQAIGTITLGSVLLRVSVSPGGSLHHKP